MSSNSTSNNSSSAQRWYLTPKDLKKEYDKSIADGKPSERLLLMFEKIAKHSSNAFPSRNQCDKDSCINYALTQAWLKWDKFDSTVSNNIFSFFTTMIMNDLRNEYNRLTQAKQRKKYLHISIDALFAGGDKG